MAERVVLKVVELVALRPLHFMLVLRRDSCIDCDYQGHDSRACQRASGVEELRGAKRMNKRIILLIPFIFVTAFSFLLGMIAMDTKSPISDPYFLMKRYFIRYRPQSNDIFRAKEAAFSGATPQGSIVMIGDSLTDFGQWNDLLHRHDIINRGIAFDSSQGLLIRAKNETSFGRIVFIMIGINDLEQNQPVKSTIDNISDIVKNIPPGRTIILESTLFTSNPRLNKGVSKIVLGERNICAKLGCQFLDLNAILSADDKIKRENTVDGIHLTAAGYRKWASAIQPILNSAAPSN